MSEQKNELRQIITDALVSMVSGVTGLVPPTGPGAIPDFIQAPIDRAVEKVYATQQPGPDVRSLLSADDVRDACANAVSVFAEETNAAQCREVAEYMREVLLAQIARRQAQPQ